VSRIDGRFGAADGVQVDARAILAELEANDGDSSRKDAVVKYLSASEGWREASAKLGGAFASGEEAGLSSRKAR
jgi:hypothetical protein